MQKMPKYQQTTNLQTLEAGEMNPDQPPVATTVSFRGSTYCCCQIKRENTKTVSETLILFFLQIYSKRN
jgi:hypothetical protein